MAKIACLVIGRFCIWNVPYTVIIIEMSIFSADKLLTDVDNVVTFYIDNRIENDFMRNAVSDVQAMSDIVIPTTESQVE